MSIPLYPTTQLGTCGELALQFLLMAEGIEAVAPLRDSGTDLIAFIDGRFQSIQVKSTRGKYFKLTDKLFEKISKMDYVGFMFFDQKFGILPKAIIDVFVVQPLHLRTLASATRSRLSPIARWTFRVESNKAP